MTARSLAIPLTAFVSDCGHESGHFCLLNACGQWRENDEPGVSNRRVWRRDCLPGSCCLWIVCSCVSSFCEACGSSFPACCSSSRQVFLETWRDLLSWERLRAWRARLPASGEWVLLCPSASDVGAVTGSAAAAAPARTTRPPSSATAVPGSSSRLRCELEVSCSSRRRRRSSGGEID